MKHGSLIRIVKLSELKNFILNIEFNIFETRILFVFEDFPQINQGPNYIQNNPSFVSLPIIPITVINYIY